MPQPFNMDNHAAALWQQQPEVLQMLLVDHTRSADNWGVHTVPELKDVHYIRWCTTDYEEQYGATYAAMAEITPDLISGTSERENIVRRRSQKSRDEQVARSKGKAEVFTPSWVCNAQNNLIDDAWFTEGMEDGSQCTDIFNHQEITSSQQLTADSETLGWTTNPDKVSFIGMKPTHTWRQYVIAKRMEVTCGEAPYLTSRYDAVTNRFIPVPDRIGLLDRKLRIVSENAEPDKWLDASFYALGATYGFEWQGDSLFIARKEILFTWMEHYQYYFPHQKLNYQSVRKAAIIISWNLWQMDGLRFCVPDTDQPCRVRDWQRYNSARKNGGDYYHEFFRESVNEETPQRQKSKPKRKSRKQDDGPSLDFETTENT